MKILIKLSPSMVKAFWNNKGVSLVEIVLASALFVLLVAGLGGSMLYGRQATIFSGYRSQALFLAQEGLEAARNIRDNNFSNLINGTHGLATSSSEWVFSGSSDSKGIFTRQISITTVDADRKQVSSQVTWQHTPQRLGSVNLVTYLTNWIDPTVVPVPISCNFYCIGQGYSSGICRPNPGQCNQNGETYESGGNNGCTIAPNDTCCCL